MILQVELLLSDHQIATDTGAKLLGRPSPITGRIAQEMAQALVKEMMQRDGVVKIEWETAHAPRTYENVTRVRASVVVGREVEYTPPMYTHTWAP